MKILVLNAGSSSQKSCIYDINPDNIPAHSTAPLWEATIDWTVNDDYGLLKVEANQEKVEITIPTNQRPSSIPMMLETITTGKTKVLDSLTEITKVGHRVVHGGAEYNQACVITPEVKSTIAKLIPLAPNHNPAHLEGINAIEEILPDTVQIALFDTAFHTTIPPEAKIYPLPYKFYGQGIQRYGFHGISHQYVAKRASQILNKPLCELNLITCHLGNGCSITAIKNGQSINTSMGFTPLEGVMMGARCGSIDPAILIHLITEYNYSAPQLNHLLNKESGLLGVSGISADLRPIISALDDNPQAQLAFNIYIHRLQSVIASMLPCLGGLRALVFTAGVGENSALVREKVCSGLSYLGLKLDLDKNATKCINTNIAQSNSSAEILVIHTEEDWAIALQCLKT